MVDPDGIIIASHNKNNAILINEVPTMDDILIWDLEDEKELKKFYTAIEKEIRNSYEYRAMINYLKEFCGMNQCAFLKIDANDNNKIKIEIHHYPFTLYDIVQIVYRKRIFYQESLSIYMIAKECTMLHYKLLVGLIPLSTTVHQLYHDNKLFIPVDNVFGRYKLFVEIYKPFCEEQQLETLERIEKYSHENSDVNDTTILETNNISFNVKNHDFLLPDINTLENNMNHRIEDIKKNNYKLPNMNEIKELERKDTIEDRKMKTYTCPIFFN